MTWNEPVSLSDPGFPLYTQLEQTQYWLRLLTPEKNQTKIKNPQAVPTATLLGPSGSWEGGCPGCQGLLLSSHTEKSFSSTTQPPHRPDASPLLCSWPCMSSTERLVAPESPPNCLWGHLPGTATVEPSNSECACPEGQHLRCLSGALSCNHQSCVVKAPAARWHTWEMIWKRMQGLSNRFNRFHSENETDKCHLGKLLTNGRKQNREHHLLQDSEVCLLCRSTGIKGPAS